jgi:hypothetical protein
MKILPAKAISLVWGRSRTQTRNKLEVSVNIDNLPVNEGRTAQALAEQLAHIQQDLAPLLTAYAWGETHQNRCLLVHRPRWYIQAVLAGEHLDIEQFNAVMTAIDTAAVDDASDAFSDALQRELKIIRLSEVTFTQWSYAAELLGQDQAWRDSMYKTYSDRA